VKYRGRTIKNWSKTVDIWGKNEPLFHHLALIYHSKHSDFTVKNFWPMVGLTGYAKMVPTQTNPNP
jgi:hypothetical protein